MRDYKKNLSGAYDEEREEKRLNLNRSGEVAAL